MESTLACLFIFTTRSTVTFRFHSCNQLLLLILHFVSTLRYSCTRVVPKSRNEMMMMMISNTAFNLFAALSLATFAEGSIGGCIRSPTGAEVLDGYRGFNSIENTINQKGLVNKENKPVTFESGTTKFDNFVVDHRWEGNGGEWMSNNPNSDATIKFEFDELHWVSGVALWHEDSMEPPPEGETTFQLSGSVDGVNFFPITLPENPWSPENNPERVNYDNHVWLFGAGQVMETKIKYIKVEMRNCYSPLQLAARPNARSVCSIGEIAFQTECDGASGVGGDPHIMTWSDSWFDFHGECDLVLLDAPSYGEGLLVHARTKARWDYSYIHSVAVQIGDEILEVGGWGAYFLNGIETAELPATLSGRNVTYTKSNKRQHDFLIDLGQNQHITVKAFKDLVNIKFVGFHQNDFKDCRGLMGEWETGVHYGRDGNSVIEDDNAFGFEWQVRDDEPNLFASRGSGPHYPEQCRMPDMTSESRRRLRASVSKENAEKACAGVTNGFDQCVYDVIATGDLEVAQAGVY